MLVTIEQRNHEIHNAQHILAGALLSVMHLPDRLLTSLLRMPRRRNGVNASVTMIFVLQANRPRTSSVPLQAQRSSTSEVNRVSVCNDLQSRPVRRF